MWHYSPATLSRPLGRGGTASCLFRPPRRDRVSGQGPGEKKSISPALAKPTKITYRVAGAVVPGFGLVAGRYLRGFSVSDFRVVAIRIGKVPPPGLHPARRDHHICDVGTVILYCLLF